MKNTLNLKTVLRTAGIIAIVVIIGFSMACGGSSGSSGGDDSKGGNPNSRTITWNQSSTDYKLTLTQLGSSSTYTYILSIGGSSYSAGKAAVSGNNFVLTPINSKTGGSGSSVTITIDSSTNKVTTSGVQSISSTSDGSSFSSSSIPVTDATCVITDNTGGVGSNPFVGTWNDVQAGTLTVKSNLTWSITTGFSGSYAYIDTTAIVYQSNGTFFGYATVSGNSMFTYTAQGDFTFTK